MDKFASPQEVSAVEMAFGGNMKELLPPYSEIPEEFKSSRNRWVQWQNQWFYSGLKEAPAAKAGIDAKAAIRHLGAIQGSFEPKHEHKEAGVAYLASRWFK